MNEFNELNNNKYAYLRCLSIEELLDLLAIAPIPTASPEKQAYVDALKEAIIEKESENPTGFFPDIDQQWKQFVTHYLPDMDEAALELEWMEHAVSAQINQQFPEVPSKRVVQFSRMWRTALVAAAAVACVFGIMLTAQAIGIDVFGAMARWTKDVFSFGQIPPDSVVSENLGGETGGCEISAQEQMFASLQEALDAYRVTEVHEPTWLPEGYALEELDVTCLDDPFFVAFAAEYVNGNDYMSINIMSYEDEPNIQVEKTDASVEMIEQNGTTYYMMENTVGSTIAWCTEQYEYCISGKIDKAILGKIAMSMCD